jgi:hypothetical protein
MLLSALPVGLLLSPLRSLLLPFQWPYLFFALPFLPGFIASPEQAEP